MAADTIDVSGFRRGLEGTQFVDVVSRSAVSHSVCADHSTGAAADHVPETTICC